MTFAKLDHISDPGTLSRMPAWVTSARAETLEDVAFLSGAALSHLHVVLGCADVPHALLRDRTTGAIGPMHLKHILRQIEPDRDNLRHGRPPSGSLQSHLGTSMPSGAVTSSKPLRRLVSGLQALDPERECHRSSRTPAICDGQGCEAGSRVGRRPVRLGNLLCDALGQASIDK